jgi:hypothetical protein
VTTTTKVLRKGREATLERREAFGKVTFRVFSPNPTHGMRFDRLEDANRWFDAIEDETKA